MGGGGSSKFDGGGGLSQNMGGVWGQLKMLLKNTCEGVQLIVNFPAIGCKPPSLLKMNFFTHIFQGF